jgi:hypothetical protein
LKEWPEVLMLINPKSGGRGGMLHDL